MSIPQRTVSITGVFAEDATTTIPTPPAADTAYRDTNMTATEVKEGWPYKKIVDSSKFNQAMYEYSSITQMVEKYGFLPWSQNTDYEQGSLALGTNGVVYQAKQATGPSSTAYNPVNDSTATYWENYLSGIMGLIYPVGSIYIGTQSTCPMAALISGSTWVLVSAGKALWTGNGKNANTTIAAGLPNITGTLPGQDSTNTSWWNRVSGAFAKATTGNNKNGITGIDTNNTDVSFSASRSNSIYGNSTTVQPPAYVVNVWRRTA